MLTPVIAEDAHYFKKRCFTFQQRLHIKFKLFIIYIRGKISLLKIKTLTLKVQIKNQATAVATTRVYKYLFEIIRVHRKLYFMSLRP